MINEENSHPYSQKKIIVGISGASGAIYGIKIVEFLKKLGVEVHLIISKAAAITIKSETDYSMQEIIGLANYNYHESDISAPISSGSFKTQGMIIAPCSIKTMSSVAAGIESNLLIRAANVVLKERRKLVLMVRETPLHAGHLESMLKLAQHGAIIAPPMPAFYNLPKTIEDVINYSAARILDLFDFDIGTLNRWQGL